MYQLAFSDKLKRGKIAMEEAVVMYPSPAVGHLVSTVELAKFMLLHRPSGLSIHILIATLPYNSGSTTSYIDSVSTTTPSIKFHHLPVVTLPSTTTSTHPMELTFETLENSIPHVHEALLSITKSYNVSSLIIDMLCFPARSAASRLSIPCYFFFTSGAGVLAFCLYSPTINRSTDKSLKDPNCLVDFPGLPPLPTFPTGGPTPDGNTKAHGHFINCATSMSESAGIIINTFDLLEHRAVKAIREGLCVPDKPTPPIFCVGPLIAAEEKRNNSGGAANDDDCLTWLDKQPSRSVVFLCFGSLGSFTEEQLREIAVGLERSGQRFLWVVRNPAASNSQRVATTALPDPDLDSLLPEGFLERTKETGRVVKSWAPQVAVLNHGSVGGFVTHCGWNSVLEALCGGVPMVAWPLYAEQRMNKILMVEEMKIALPMNESETGLVSASEVEKRVKELMDSEAGNTVREKTIAMQNAAKDAMSEGGSSRVALSKLLQSWKGE